MHAPWFLLSLEIVDAEELDCSMTRTLCIAWDNDLADVLRSIDADRVMGIVCMMPAWASPTGQWTSREVGEVWMCASAAGRSVMLCDAAGEEFDCGLVPQHEPPLMKELVLRIAPTRPQRRPPSQGKHRPSNSRRSRRARAPKVEG